MITRRHGLFFSFEHFALKALAAATLIPVVVQQAGPCKEGSPP